MILDFMMAGLAGLAVLLYVLLDGADLGVGILLLVAPRERERADLIRSIEPFWDGNETWLVFGGVTLFSAFPVAYTTLLTRCYGPLMAMLSALILRGIAFEFHALANRSRSAWGLTFGAASLVAAMAQGVVLGAVLDGSIAETVAASSIAAKLFELGCGAGVICGYALLGASWGIWKTQSATQIFAREVAHAAVIGVAVCIAGTAVWAALFLPEVTAHWRWSTAALAHWLTPIATAGLLIVLWRSLWSRRDWLPRMWTMLLFVVAFIGLITSIWPYVIPYSTTVMNAAAGPATLRFVATGAIVIVPIILSYTLYGFWTFRGKVQPPGPEPENFKSRRAASQDDALHLS